MLQLVLAHVLVKKAYDMGYVGLVVVVVVYFYFLYCNKQTSAKIWWVFEVITPSQQDGI